MRNPWVPVTGEKMPAVAVAYVLLWLALWMLVLTQVAVPLAESPIL